VFVLETKTPYLGIHHGNRLRTYTLYGPQRALHAIPVPKTKLCELLQSPIESLVLALFAGRHALSMTPLLASSPFWPHVASDLVRSPCDNPHAVSRTAPEHSSNPHRLLKHREVDF
jgi:hypothetical protein